MLSNSAAREKGDNATKLGATELAATDLMAEAKRLSFAGEFEALFREDYFHRSIAFCRAALAASALLFLLFGILDSYAVPSAKHLIWFIRYVLIAPLCLFVCVLSWLPIFRRIMQPVLGVMLLLVGLGIIAMAAISQPGELGYLFYPIGLMLTTLFGYSFVRLRFWHATIPSLVHVLTYIGVALFYQKILTVPQGLPIFLNHLFFIGAANIAGMATCYSLELYARRGFVSQYLLQQERASERRKRERTEGMLQILNQAIGGVVHDLGNPLTAVQVGAQTLEAFVEQGETNSEDFKECLGIIVNGAQMLDYLRLSLMEQTRTLDETPIPLQRERVSVRSIVEAGARYQKPKFRFGHNMTIIGDDVEISADKMKMITVLMNLIGNALKYSDGEVRISWRTTDEHLLIAVCDQGRAGQGISEAQARQLFVAFSRLESHGDVEGTGLGLFSVRKIAETHGGEVFIEGIGDADNQDDNQSQSFSSAQGTYPSMMHEEFRTAFVIACPLRHE